MKRTVIFFASLAVAFALKDPICYQEEKAGPCLALIPRYRFDAESRRCVQFNWGGCEPNENNFKTLSDCQCKCESVCDLIYETGPCKAAIKSFWYNPFTAQCENFTYGGCEGNGNRFASLAECQAQCDSCKLPADSGTCFGYFPRYYYNAATKCCDKFVYGGCNGNANNFEEYSDCQESCSTCFLPLLTGPCRALFRKWGYNTKTGQCEEFVWGGCQGNPNRYDSEIECKNACGPFISFEPQPEEA